MLVRYRVSELDGVIGGASSVSAPPLVDLPLVKDEVRALHCSLIDELHCLARVEVGPNEKWARLG